MRKHLPLMWVTVLAVLTLLVYLPGLNGSFLFDDTPNILAPLSSWLSGQSNWAEFVLGNRSGPLGRVLSMLSFAANGATTGLAVWPFKLTNLLIHLACGGILYLFLAKMLRHDRFLASQARLVAGLITTIWLLHPIQVSTVLYVVQRMAQLSTLFMLLALWAFVSGRELLNSGNTRRAAGMLLLAVPMFTVLATASKENGALVPLLCAVIELAYFRPRQDQMAPSPGGMRLLRGFLIAFVAGPLLLAATLLALKPGIFLDGYDGRLFTFGQRLLSEPRVLLDYVGILLLPRGAALGLYTDDFPVSRGLFDPPSTFLALAILGGWMITSVLLKKRSPSFFAGTWLFLGGHALESTIFPLEIYFEHRNYMPSIGIFLALAGLLSLALPRIRSALPERSRNRLPAAGALLVLLLLAAATTVRSQVWASWVSIAEQGIREHPQSRRAHLDKISILLKLEWTDEARELMLQMKQIPDPNAFSAATLNLAWLDCRENARIAEDDVSRLAGLAGRKLQLADLFGGEKLGKLLLEKPCQGLTRKQFADVLRDMTAQSQQSPGNVQVWRLRFMASRLYAKDNLLGLAIEQSALAWMTQKADPAVGVFLINLYLAAGDHKSAEILLPEVRARIAPWDQRNLEQLTKVLDYFSSADATNTKDAK